MSDPAESSPSPPGGDAETGRFLADVMLGKLATYLRMCGYDTVYAGERGIEADDRLRDLAREESRTLLTRDVELATRTEHALLVESLAVDDQLEELREAGVRPALEEHPSRCGRCNGRLERVPSDAETPAYAPDPDDVDCWRCRACGQYFWKGSHWDRVSETLG